MEFGWSDEQNQIRKTASEFAEREIAPYVAEYDLGRAPTLKKMIFRAATEEIIARTDAKKQTLQFTIHSKGRTLTQVEMERLHSAAETGTPIEALEIIRGMAVRQGDDRLLPC
jgi:hypothetical protein